MEDGYANTIAGLLVLGEATVLPVFLAVLRPDELKRRGITYAQLSERLATIGVVENERNLNNKISRGGFSAAFMIQCLESIGCADMRL